MTLHLLKLHKVPIFKQLKLEEALLRTSDKNYCIINYDAPKAIVMGISGKPQELIQEAAFSSGVPVIKRFSGGGTVAVDEDTLFISYIFNTDEHSFQPYPEPIYRWSAMLYQNVFPSSFLLKENDYALGDKKFGGNAQYIRKGRWLHHSTFLWDYAKEHMDLLKIPKKQPPYRSDRSHDEFLCTLKEHFPSKDAVFQKLKDALAEKYSLNQIDYSEAAVFLESPHRSATTIVNAFDKKTR